MTGDPQIRITRRLAAFGLAILPAVLEYTARDGKRRTWQHTRVIHLARDKRRAA